MRLCRWAWLARKPESAARQWFDIHLRPLAIRSAALGRDVGFNRVGREKFISQAADRRKLALLAAVPDIIRKGHLVSSELPRGGDSGNLKAVHRLAGDVEMNWVTYYVQVVVRETLSGDFYYTHYIEDRPATPGEPGVLQQSEAAGHRGTEQE